MKIKIPLPIILAILCCSSFGQAFDTSIYGVTVDSSEASNRFFTTDPHWRGGDGASSIDLGNGKILWLFGDSFVCSDSSGSRKNATMIRNSVAIQDGHDLSKASIKYYWQGPVKKPGSFFPEKESMWFWPGHGTMIKDRLLLFFMKERSVKTGLGFETTGWTAVLIFNPTDEPSKWKMKYIDGPSTFGTIAGSAAVVTEGNYLYAYGAVEPGTHESYLLRWKSADAYTGNFSGTQWWINGRWAARKSKAPIRPLFTGATEYSVHYDSVLKKYVQVQSFGFGESKIGVRLSDHMQGPWTEPYLFYTPDYAGIQKPFMYSAKAHPELHGSGIAITYNINSFNSEELFRNQSIYFPKLITIRIAKKN